MASIVNRQDELDEVERTLKDLTGGVRLVRRPILDFYGFNGMGKSRLLAEIGERCRNQEKKVNCLEIVAGRDLPALSPEAMKQIPLSLRKDAQQPTSLDETLNIMKKLLEEPDPLVVLIDAIDNTDQKQMHMLERLLSLLVRSNKVFIVLASQQKLSFEQRRDIARKLHARPIEPLGKEHMQEYLLMLSTILSLTQEQEKLITEQQDLIFAWTRGYPLAIKEMVHALQQFTHIDDDAAYRSLMQYMVNKIFVEQLLVKVDEDQRDWFQAILPLLAVPRRFNLLLMQRLVQRFEPVYEEKGGSLAYMLWPRRINEATGVLHWKIMQSGFIIEEPMRTILLLPLKVGKTETYREINLFLAEINWENAREAQGFDRVQYAKEYLYHRLVAAQEHEKPSVAQEAMQNITRIADLQPDELIRFEQEFLDDDELQEISGTQLQPVLSQLYQALVRSLERSYTIEKDQQQRASLLENIFRYAARLPDRERALAKIKEHMDSGQKENDPAWLLDIYQRLEQDRQFLTVMGNEYDVLIEEMRNAILHEE